MSSSESCVNAWSIGGIDMQRIVTMCRQGLVRSVALADVLKLHFEPVDVVPVGYFGNTEQLKDMLFEWADAIIVMEQKYNKHVHPRWAEKVYVCEVGPDTYGNSHNPVLISKVWEWCRKNQTALKIKEHNKRF
jgi:predicted protein tyrosine phosphatase